MKVTRREQGFIHFVYGARPSCSFLLILRSAGPKSIQLFIRKIPKTHRGVGISIPFRVTGRKSPQCSNNVHVQVRYCNIQLHENRNIFSQDYLHVSNQGRQTTLWG